MPTIVTLGWLYWGVTLEYVNYIVLGSVIAGFLYQAMDALFLYGISTVQTEVAQSLWKQIEEDEELWSLKLNIWITMLFSVGNVISEKFAALSLFFSLAVIYCLYRYMKHVVRYDDAVNKINEEQNNE